ncbi:MAG: D-3-phosphoglycerate dehydrogenase [Sphingobacteriales bacterium]|jgi:D-3-phosphoglycerate dehydrogenase
MIRILANDGIAPIGIEMLEDAGYEVVTDNIHQEKLPTELQNFDAILVRSATTVRKELIDNCPNLKLIGRGGVGMDNIDVDYARNKGIIVINTPAASSDSVAELVFSHLFSLSRSLYLSNKEMPASGDTQFGKLKKKYSKGTELRGKKIGIIGFGRIGQATAKIAFGLGMEVYASNLTPFDSNLTIQLGGKDITLSVNQVSQEELLKTVDIVSLHIPHSAKKPAVIGTSEFGMMKDGAIIVNCARGGVIDEDALLSAIDSGKIKGAGLDVFVNEPTPRKELLNHPNISTSPHIGAATLEAQDRVGSELADQIISYFKKNSPVNA